jgi:hypothetical protein
MALRRFPRKRSSHNLASRKIKRDRASDKRGATNKNELPPQCGNCISQADNCKNNPHKFSWVCKYSGIAIRMLRTILTSVDALVWVTSALVVVSVLQYFTLEKTDDTLNRQITTSIESERAFLIVQGVSFLHGEPAISLGGLDFNLVVRNTGRHVGTITKMVIAPAFFTNPDPSKRNLPDIPDYAVPVFHKTAPPIPPLDQTNIVLQMREVVSEIGVSWDSIKEDRINGTVKGTYPLRVYGYIDYETGFATQAGVVGFCFEYIPPAKRVLLQFETCDSKYYTFTR